MLHLFPNDNKRIAWIDVTRALALFLVVWTHFDTTPLFHGWAYGVHIPTFFFLSGLLYAMTRKQLPWVQYVKQQVIFLLWPYLVVSTVSLVFFFFFRLFFTDYTVASMFYYMLIGRPMGIAGMLWFLPSLFWIRIIFDAYLRLRPPRFVTAALVVVSFVFAASLYPAGYNGVFWSLDIIPLTFVFYGLGYLAQPIMNRVTTLSFYTKLAGLFVSLFISVGASLAMRNFFAVFPNIANNRMGDPVLFLFVFIFGGAFLICLAQLVSTQSILRWVGERTLVIYSWHLLLLETVLLFVEPFFFYSTAVRMMLTLLLTIGIMVCIGLVSDRYTKKPSS